MNVDISVIIYAKDAAHTLARATRAALAQEGAIEVVIVDDCSGDTTAKQAAELSLEDSARIRVASHTTPQGRAESCRSGLKIARGTFVFFMDAADKLAPEALPKLLTLAQEHEADLILPAVTAPAAASSDEKPSVIPAADGAILDALYGPNRKPPIAHGAFMAHTLAKSGFAEIEQGVAATAEAALFVIATKATKLVITPEPALGAATEAVAEPADSPALAKLDRAAFNALCAKRTGAEQVADYLTRAELWESAYSAWEHFAVALCQEPLACLATCVDPTLWPDAAETLLSAWGTPYVAAALANFEPSDVANTLVALASAPRLNKKTQRPGCLCLVVTPEVPLEQLLKLYDALTARRVACLFAVEQGVDLPASLNRLVTLPALTAPLARARALDDALKKSCADGLIAFAGNVGLAADELVARDNGAPVALFAAKKLTTLDQLFSVTAQAALASCVVCQDATDAAFWQLLGVRMGGQSDFVSQLALGTTTRADASSRELASRVLNLAASYVAAQAELKAQADAAQKKESELTATVNQLNDRVADLERRLEAATTERDELHATLDEHKHAGLIKRVFGRSQE